MNDQAWWTKGKRKGEKRAPREIDPVLWAATFAASFVAHVRVGLIRTESPDIAREQAVQSVAEHERTADAAVRAVHGKGE